MDKTPGDDFADRTDWRDILEPSGWVWVIEPTGSLEYAGGQGRTMASSATIGHSKGFMGLKVFSSSTSFPTTADETHEGKGVMPICTMGGRLQGSRQGPGRKSGSTPGSTMMGRSSRRRYRTVGSAAPPPPPRQEKQQTFDRRQSVRRVDFRINYAALTDRRSGHYPGQGTSRNGRSSGCGSIVLAVGRNSPLGGRRGLGKSFPLIAWPRRRSSLAGQEWPDGKSGRA